MNGVVLPGVVGEQDVVDVVGLAEQLELGESVLAAGVVVLAIHGKFDGVLAGVRSVMRVLQCFTTSVAARTGVTNKPAKARAVTFFLLIMIVL